MKLSEIEAVGYLLTAYDEEDVYEDGDINYDVFELHRDKFTQNDMNKCGLNQWDFCDCQAIYTADQMQEYAKECVIDALKEYAGPYSDKKANSIISRVVK